MHLVVVESPNKVAKIRAILGRDYEVAASSGHVADLPARGDLAVEFRDGQVIPRYEPLERSSRAISHLRQLAKRAESIILATDPDREGEAIAWHVLRLMETQRPVQRVVFNAVTETAIRKAMAQPRQLDQGLVDAQQARRVLDRVVGWVVSPTLRRGCKNPQAKSAGRVQSAALRLVCEREREINSHATAVFFAIDALVTLPESGNAQVWVRLSRWKGEELGHRLDSLELAERTLRWCRNQPWKVANYQQRIQRRRPPPPFTTATVQQAASVRLRMNPKATMATLQKLFEQGHITYHRTDSTALDPEAVTQAREIIRERFGPALLPAQPVLHQTKGANTQEAHEAIRPTHPEQGPDLRSAGDGAALYRLIWERFIACQMADGSDEVSTIDIAVAPDGWTDEQGQVSAVGVFSAKVTRVIEAGWRQLGDDSTDEPAKRRRSTAKDDDDDESPKNSHIPPAKAGDPALPEDMRSSERKTKAPARYTQASLIKRLEKEGIGRPSTYATIMTTLLDRNYVVEKQRKLQASELGMTVTDYLVHHFVGDFIDLAYTARLEAALDAVARGERIWHQVVTVAAERVRDAARLAGLWYDPLAGGAPAAGLPDCPNPCPLCAASMVARNGPYGPFYACSVRSCPGILDAQGKPNRKTRELLNKRSRKKPPKDNS
ncbi:MAG: type I DNA topoisomerase [Planctomycetota bacterium]|nr:MAG: type I DNA topoisomerase [Planctomycetota bacterium]